MNSFDIANLIIKKIQNNNIEKLSEIYQQSGKIKHLVIDDLLPKELALKLSQDFPSEKNLKKYSRFAEKKFVGIYFERSQKIVEECIYAFQDEKVVQAISQISGINNLITDEELYAGGISSMSKGCFLNPHIDNSHDRKLNNYRRINILYYVNYQWESNTDGGELMLYPFGTKMNEVRIPCNFNRLVIMETNKRSLHAVSKVKSNSNRRKCISNYYFSRSSPNGKIYYHSTSFQGFKGEYLKGNVLRLNSFCRTKIKKLIYFLSKISLSTDHHKKNFP